MYGKRIAETRQDHDESQRELARILDTSQAMIWRYENDISDIPVRHLKTICLHYNTSADYILGLPRNLKWPR